MPRKKLWVGAVRASMKHRGTVGVFSTKARAMGVSTATLARRWSKKPGIWGKRARLAMTFKRLRTKRGTTRTRARRR